MLKWTQNMFCHTVNQEVNFELVQTEGSSHHTISPNVQFHCQTNTFLSSISETDEDQGLELMTTWSKACYILVVFY